jgi:hypothetical protein
MGLGRNLPMEDVVRTSFAQLPASTFDRCNIARVTINMLPDVALLRIFEFYLYKKPIEAWRTLVHVSRNWRIVIFGSPRRLDLRLYCNARTPVREILDVWPPLPIVLWSVGHEKRGVENILAALEHNDRITIVLSTSPHFACTCLAVLCLLCTCLFRPCADLSHRFVFK